jgi:hypothetical protein
METLRLAREWANIDALVKRHTEEVEMLEAASGVAGERAAKLPPPARPPHAAPPAGPLGIDLNPQESMPPPV